MGLTVRLKQLVKRVLSLGYDYMKSASVVNKYQKLIKDGTVVVGRHTYGVPIVYVYPECESKLIIGSFSSIATGITILLGGNHPADWVSTFPFRARLNLPGAYKDGMPYSNGDIVIGSDVWVGLNATILSGVTIGDGAVVASGSLVSKDVPPYAIVGGVPAKVLGYRFDSDIIQQLQLIKWWEWSDDDIRKMIPLLSSGKIDEFILCCSGNFHGASR